MVLVMRIFDKSVLNKAQLLALSAEASILRQLHHRNLVQILSEHDTNSSLCQVFELSLVCMQYDLYGVYLSTARAQPLLRLDSAPPTQNCSK